MRIISLVSSPLTLASLHLKSPKPRSKRLNHLRRKLPKTLTLTPIPLPSPPENTAPPTKVAFETQHIEQVSSITIDAAVNRSWFPDGVAGLALRFVALIAVQTAVAVWFYGGVSDGVVEEGKKVKEVRKEERKVSRMPSEVSLFEEKVSEIRAMAREVREREKRESDEGSGGESEVLLRKMVDSLDRIGSRKKDSVVKMNGREAREKERRGVGGRESRALLEGKSEIDLSSKVVDILDRIGSMKMDSVDVTTNGREVREKERRGIGGDGDRESEVLLEGVVGIDLSRKMDDVGVVSDLNGKTESREARENRKRGLDVDKGSESEVLLEGKARIDSSRKMDDLQVVSDRIGREMKDDVDGKTNGREASERERRGINGGSGVETEVLLEDKSRIDSLSKVTDQIGRNKNDNVDGRTNGRRMDYRRKMSYLNSIAKIDSAPKGFGRSKSSGDAKQIQDNSSMDAAALLHQPREPKAKIDGIVVPSSPNASENVNSSLETSVNSNVGAIGNQVKIESSLNSKNNSSNSYTSQCQRSMTEHTSNTMHSKTAPTIKKDHQNAGLTTNAKIKLWWLKLPYVLAILLCRGVKREGPRGLYSLQMNGSADENAESYTVVFQDRGDATNFCYLLESFFEDLSNVSADIVPMTIKELYKAVESRELNVLVVRKGQLNLYAGQPLTEVETVLRSLVY